MTEYFSQPDDTPEIKASDLHSSLGERLGAQAGEAAFGTMRAVTRNVEYATARGQAWPGMNMPEEPSAQDISELESYRKETPDVSMADAKARLKDQGLEGHVKLPGQTAIKQPVLDLMIAHGHERRQHQAAIERAPGLLPDALGFITEMGVGLIDPMNIAAFSIPVLGEARYGKFILGAGDSIAARAGVRAGAGAAQAAVGSAALVPEEWWLHTNDGVDYTMADALRSVVLGAGMGGAMHAGFGALGDVAARRRGEPLAGSSADKAGVAERSEVADDDGAAPDFHLMTDEEIALARASQRPGLVLSDLPARVREDATHAAMADVIQGNAVRSAQLLTEAAKGDPRIAESLGIEVYHGSPHDFEAFSMDRIGTGEGAQSYGHGLYFAEQPAVSEEYRRANMPELSEIEHAARMALHKRDRAGAADNLKNLMENARLVLNDDPSFIPAREELARLKQALSLIEGGWEPPKGNLYKVRINADREHFLDWDKPLSEQTQDIQDKLKAVMGETKWNELKHANTSTAIKQGFIAFSDEQVSAKLREAGIPGIKYLDQGSRNAGGWHITAPDQTVSGKWMVKSSDYNSKGLHFDTEAEAKTALADKINKQTHNLVLFDDKLAQITHKNGEPLTKAERADFVSQNEGGSTKTSQAPNVGAIDNTHDVLSGANSSKDPNGPVYIDRRIPQFSPTLKDANGQPADLHKYLAVHERAERAAVEADGVNWKGYTEEIDGYLSHIEHEAIANPPPNTHVDPAVAVGHHRSENKANSPRDTTDQAAPRAAGESPAPTGVPDWGKLEAAKQPPDGDLAVASREADTVKDIESTDPAKAVSAAEKAAAESDALLADILPSLTDEERVVFQDALDRVAADKQAHEDIVRQGAACLVAAVA